MAHYDWVDDKHGTCKDCGKDFSYGEGVNIFINDKNNIHAEDELVELCNKCVHKHKVRDYTYDGMKYINYRKASQYWFGVKDIKDLKENK